VVEEYEFIVRVVVTEPPPDYQETILRILQKEVATRMGPSATVRHLPTAFPMFVVPLLECDDAYHGEVHDPHPWTNCDVRVWCNGRHQEEGDNVDKDR
jgi:hypothetical protein